MPRVARAAAAGCRIAKLPSAGRQAGLVGVSVTSSRNAWAVGIRSHGAALIEHWNGKVWKVQASSKQRGAGEENPFTGVDAISVAATSTTDAWAITSPLIQHWDGKAWKIQPSPHNGELSGVAATSPSNAWAAGTTSDGRSLIEHWNGKAWTVQASPNPGSGNLSSTLSGVAATSARNAWAVGAYWNLKRAMYQTLIEHWNGKAWRVQASPTPRNSDGPSLSELSAVAATSSTNAWAVGNYWGSSGPTAQTLIVHWNGKAWTVQPSPPLSASNFDNRLLGVAATSRANAWVVGTYANRLGRRTLVEHWDGRAWTVQTSPNLRGFAFNQLSGVATTAPTNAWAVGYIARLDNATGAPPDKALTLHCS